MRDGLEAGAVRPLVSVLVVSRRRPARLRALLASVARQDYAPTEVRVLANGCAETAALVRAEFPDAALRELPENVGSAPGRNRVAEGAKGEYLLFLDDDGELRSPDIVTRLVAVLAADPRAGLASMGLLDAASDEPTGWLLQAGRLTFRCYHASFAGGACLVRAEAFRAAGGYCEGFTGPSEEFDLAVRLYAAGFAVVHVPDVRFHHWVEKTDEDWRQRVSDGYAHLQYTIWRLYPWPWSLLASMKALATQVWIDVRQHRGVHVVSELAKSHVWAHAGRRVKAPVPLRALELMYFAKYFRVETWNELERAPPGTLRRVLGWRLRRKRLDVPKLPLSGTGPRADTPNE